MSITDAIRARLKNEAKQLWTLLDKRQSHKVYMNGKACKDKKVIWNYMTVFRTWVCLSVRSTKQKWHRYRNHSSGSKCDVYPMCYLDLPACFQVKSHVKFETNRKWINKCRFDETNNFSHNLIFTTRIPVPMFPRR